jgi:hypothetical protein
LEFRDRLSRAAERGLDSDIGDGAYHEQPDVGTEDELAREVEALAAALESFERALAS